jgi:hypothetical protein
MGSGMEKALTSMPAVSQAALSISSDAIIKRRLSRNILSGLRKVWVLKFG